jgi:tRNA splicing ligase
MNNLLNHLLKTYSKPFLFELFGISAGVWRQHKHYTDTNGLSGTVLSNKHHKPIRDKYIEFLRDKVSEVSDIDCNVL